MRDAEDVARDLLGCESEFVPPGRTAAGARYCIEHNHPWLHDVNMCPTQERAADLIRARDAEVRTDERVKVLADVDNIARASTLTATDVRFILDAIRETSGLEWEYHQHAELGSLSCVNPEHKEAHEATAPIEVHGPDCRLEFTEATRRRLVGPWQPIDPEETP